MIWSIVIGALAGYIAGYLTKGGGFGLLINLIIGIIGGVLGGLVFKFIGLSANNIIGRLVVSVIGAIILLWIISIIRGKKE